MSIFWSRSYTFSICFPKPFAPSHISFCPESGGSILSLSSLLTKPVRPVATALPTSLNTVLAVAATCCLSRAISARTSPLSAIRCKSRCISSTAKPCSAAVGATLLASCDGIGSRMISQRRAKSSGESSLLARCDRPMNTIKATTHMVATSHQRPLKIQLFQERAEYGLADWGNGGGFMRGRATTDWGGGRSWPWLCPGRVALRW